MKTPKKADKYSEAQRLWERAVESNGTEDCSYWWELYRAHLGKYFPLHRYAKKGERK